MSTNVRELKEKITSQWHIPPICQKLLIGSDILLEVDTVAKIYANTCPAAQNSGICEEIAKGGGPLPTVTLVTDHNELYRNLVAASSSKRQTAFETLVDWANKDLQRPLTMSTMCLTDDNVDPVVRRAAVLAVGKIAPSGDTASIDALKECIHREDNWKVKAAVLEVLPKIVPRGDQDVKRMLIDGLSGHMWVKREASESLAKYAAKGDVPAIAALIDAGCLREDGEEKTQLLKYLLPAGDQESLSTVVAMLHHPTYNVRLWAAEEIVRIAPLGDTAAIEALQKLSCCASSDKEMKEKARSSLSKLKKTFLSWQDME